MAPIAVKAFLEGIAHELLDGARDGASLVARQRDQVIFLEGGRFDAAFPLADPKIADREEDCLVPPLE